MAFKFHIKLNKKIIQTSWKIKYLRKGEKRGKKRKTTKEDTVKRSVLLRKLLFLTAINGLDEKEGYPNNNFKFLFINIFLIILNLFYFKLIKQTESRRQPHVMTGWCRFCDGLGCYFLPVVGGCLYYLINTRKCFGFFILLLFNYFLAPLAYLLSINFPPYFFKTHLTLKFISYPLIYFIYFIFKF